MYDDIISNTYVKARMNERKREDQIVAQNISHIVEENIALKPMKNKH